MAVTVIQQPNTPNASNTNLLYAVSSPNAGNPQFRYVADVYESGSGDYLTTLKFYPNLTEGGVVDVARELNDRVDYALNWKQGYITSVDPVNCKTFDIRFGEEYSISLEAPRVLYTGSISNYLQVFPATVYKNEGSYNFDTASFLPTGDGSTAIGWYGDQALTNDPYKLTDQKAVYPWVGFGFNQPKPFKIVNQDDYDTLSFLSGDPDIPAQQRIQYADIQIYSGSVNLTAPGVPFIANNVDFNVQGGLITIQAGPQNLAAVGNDASVRAIFNAGPTAWTHYVIAVIYQDSKLDTLRDGYWYINDYYLGDDSLVIDGWNIAEYQHADVNYVCEGYTRFAFINEYGVFDYYSIYNPLRKQTKVDRNTYDKMFVDYSGTTSDFNISNRGTKQYRTEYTDTFEITTDYLDQPTAQWLTELLTSPEVYVQENGNFVPIVMTNNSIEWNMNQYRQKLFQYTIQFKYANQPQPR